jgi:formylglycine-generating enzyme required for sulfatase activity
MADVFISYSKARDGEAAELAAELSDLGFSVWWDPGLLPTGSYSATIDRELDAAKAVVVIWSPEAVRSKWVRAEAEHGDRDNKLVNTHTAEVGDPGRQIPKPFNQTHSVVIDNIRAIVAALDTLNVPRSGGKVAPKPLVASADSVADADDRLFAEVEKANTAEAFAYYLDELPEGRHKLIARFRLTTLRPPPSAVAPPSPPSSREKQAPKPPAKPQDKAREQSQRREERHRAEGRIRVDAEINHSAPDGWFKPGNGKTEWFKDDPDGPEMVVVPAGSFMMGSPIDPAESPRHEVTFVRPFAVGRFAVTFDEWDACLKDGGNGYLPADNGWGRGRQPVINVSWDDTQTYVAWLSRKTGKSYRLLSEAEWEYVARAGTTTPFWWGPSIATSQANYDGNFTYGDRAKGEYRARTLPVNSFEPNPWGLFQVHGNVWEWVADCWNESYAGAPTDGSTWTTGDCSRHVVRGGSWESNPRNVRAANRGADTTDKRDALLGFRVGRTLTP